MMFNARREIKISIHALREEGDCRNVKIIVCALYFYPRPPRGGRHGRISWQPRLQGFLSTPSARRATVHLVLGVQAADISIHALREEGDCTSSAVFPV